MSVCESVFLPYLSGMHCAYAPYYIVICGLSGWIIFLHIIFKKKRGGGTIFERKKKKLLDTKCVF